VIFRRKQPAGPPVPVGKRWQQLWDSDGEIVLHSFSQVERDAVALDPAAAPDTERGNYLQALPPLLARLQPDLAPAGPAYFGQDEAELLAAVDGLERLGFVRPGPPAPPVGRMPVEFPGIAAAAGGTVKPVALAGDLGLICRMRGQPLFIGEVYTAVQPARPDPDPDNWRLAGRAYIPYQFPCSLLERPAGPGGLPPHLLAAEYQAAATIMEWLGADVATFKAQWEQRRAAREAAAGTASAGSDAAGPPPLAVRTADVGSRFSRVGQLRIMQPDGEQVRVRFLVVASSAGGLYLLDGDLLESATPVSLVGLGDRVDDMLKSASAVADKPGRPDDQ
jgi:hypothetical protein